VSLYFENCFLIYSVILKGKKLNFQECMIICSPKQSPRIWCQESKYFEKEKATLSK